MKTSANIQATRGMLCAALLAAFAITQPSATGAVASVKSIAELQAAVSAAEAGAIIELTDGTYNTACKLDGKGSADRPIVVRAETQGRAEFHNRIEIRGKHITVEGFTFRAKGSVHIHGHGHRLSRSHFSDVQSGKWVVIQSGSRQVEIDHCLFEKKTNNPKLPRGCQLLQIRVQNTVEAHHIHHNHFRDIPKGGSGNGFETLQLITDGNPRDPSGGHCATVIEDNLFERCNGEAEIISIKSNGNLVQRNTFRACYGSLVLRHGHANRALANIFLGDGESGSGGVRLQGRDQVVANNHFHGLGRAAIAMMDGTPDSLYVRTERAQILHNTVVNCRYGLEVGLNHSKHPDGTVPRACTVTGNIIVVKPEAQAVRFVQDDGPEAWIWSDNMVHGTLGIPATDGIRTGDPRLRVQQNGLALPTAATPSTRSATGVIRTLGAVDIRDNQLGADPLTGNDVGPLAPVPM